MALNTNNVNSNNDVQDANEQIDEYSNQADDLENQSYVSSKTPPKASYDKATEDPDVIREGLAEYSQDLNERNNQEDLYNGDDDSSKSYPI